MACEGCDRLQRQLRAREKEVESLWLALKDKLRKPPVRELLRVASEAAQIACLNEKAFPAGSPVTDAASAVALGALKQIRERLKVGEPCVAPEKVLRDLADAIERAEGSVLHAEETGDGDG